MEMYPSTAIFYRMFLRNICQLPLTSFHSNLSISPSLFLPSPIPISLFLYSSKQIWRNQGGHLSHYGPGTESPIYTH